MVRLILLFVAAVTVSVTLVPAASSRSQKDKKLTITIVSRTQVAVPHDLAPKGRENKGDWIQYKALLLTTGPLFGKKHKNQPVGFEAGTQTYTNATDARIRGKTTFPGQGTIRFRGMMKQLPNGTIRVPVVGGTGKFAGAKGVLLIGSGEVQSVNTYRLTIPEAGSI